MSAILAVLLGTIGVLITIAGVVGLSLLSSEARGSVPLICGRLLDRTATRLPVEMQERREEWECELFEARDRPLTQVVLALRIWREGRALATEAAGVVAEAEAQSAGGFTVKAG